MQSHRRFALQLHLFLWQHRDTSNSQTFSIILVKYGRIKVNIKRKREKGEEKERNIYIYLFLLKKYIYTYIFKMVKDHQIFYLSNIIEYFNWNILLSICSSTVLYPNFVLLISFRVLFYVMRYLFLFSSLYLALFVTKIFLILLCNYNKEKLKELKFNIISLYFRHSTFLHWW